MTASDITQYIQSALAGVDVFVASKENGAPEAAWGDTFFFYDPGKTLPADRRFPFATIVTQDYAGFDTSSNLNRPGVYRLNVGVRKETFCSLFPDASGAYDYAALDQILPHPAYGKMYWVCVLNPSEATFERMKPLIQEAYDQAAKRHLKKQGVL